MLEHGPYKPGFDHAADIAQMVAALGHARFTRETAEDIVETVRRCGLTPARGYDAVVMVEGAARVRALRDTYMLAAVVVRVASSLRLDKL